MDSDLFSQMDTNDLCESVFFICVYPVGYFIY